MKKEHRVIIDQIEKYFEQPDAEHLRFWQGLFNMGVVVFENQINEAFNYSIDDDYNISDKNLIKRIIDERNKKK